MRDPKDLKIKHIRVSQGTYQTLIKLGDLDDTFDSVIKRLIKEQKEVVAAN
jgi:predicted CopG family antitoxin